MSGPSRLAVSRGRRHRGCSKSGPLFNSLQSPLWIVALFLGEVMI